MRPGDSDSAGVMDMDSEVEEGSGHMFNVTFDGKAGGCERAGVIRELEWPGRHV